MFENVKQITSPNMVKLHKKIWEVGGIKVQGYFTIGKKSKVCCMGENPGRYTDNMGRNESMAELLMKIWKGPTENRDRPIEKQGFSLSSGEYVPLSCSDVRLDKIVGVSLGNSRYFNS